MLVLSIHFSQGAYESFRFQCRSAAERAAWLSAFAQHQVHVRASTAHQVALTQHRQARAAWQAVKQAEAATERAVRQRYEDKQQASEHAKSVAQQTGVCHVK